jgi:hypothetical protein
MNQHTMLMQRLRQGYTLLLSSHFFLSKVCAQFPLCAH